MAVLSDSAREGVRSQLIHGVMERRESIGLTKADLRAAVNAIDQFLEDNASAINQAIPQPARGALSTAQKAHLLVLVALRRYGG